MFNILLLLVCITELSAKHLHSERYYQEIFCNNIGGTMEVVLSDNTRVDCLTDKYAIEVDFANKWAEGIGQSLHYGLMTSKKAGVYLIIESAKDYKYIDRVNAIANRHCIRIWHDKGIE